jgi:predicted Co/Zn/Cd cation transporter (cation efflux family)
VVEALGMNSLYFLPVGIFAVFSFIALTYKFAGKSRKAKKSVHAGALALWYLTGFISVTLLIAWIISLFHR